MCGHRQPARAGLQPVRYRHPLRQRDQPEPGARIAGAARTGATHMSEMQHTIVDAPVFDPATTAVVVVDMINEFLEDGGLMMLAAGRALYGPIQQLVDAAHAAGTTVVWLRDEHADESDTEFRKRIIHCLKGSWGTQIVDSLRPG